MRLWSLSPALLDRAALIACWREGLLAQKVLAGKTKGYTKHPQLIRFRAHPNPMEAIGYFLGDLYREATARGYKFNYELINFPTDVPPLIPVTTGQLEYELQWLKKKVWKRQRVWHDLLIEAKAAATFIEVPGEIEEWEKV